MAETAALLVDEVLPSKPIRQWVLSMPFALRYLLAPEVLTRVLGIVYRTISGHLIRKASLTRGSAKIGAVTLIQRFGSALNLNIHFHMLFLDGVYVGEGPSLRFVPVPAPSPAELQGLVQTIAERIGRSFERGDVSQRATAHYSSSRSTNSSTTRRQRRMANGALSRFSTSEYRDGTRTLSGLMGYSGPYTSRSRIPPRPAMRARAACSTDAAQTRPSQRALPSP